MSHRALPTPTPIAPPPEPPRRRHRVALAIIVTCQLMLILDATVMNVALPRIQHDLGFATTDLAWVLSAYTLTYGGLLLLGGRAGDLFGRRRMFVAGIGLFTAASFAGGFAPSAGWLLAARVLQGVGAAAAGPSTIALITTTFTEARERIRALAVLSGIASAGFAIGLIVGGILTEAASWRWVLFINVPFGVAAVVLAPRFVREPERHPARLDVRGAVLATAGVGALVYALIHAAASGWSQWRTAGPLLAGVVLLVGFVALQARSPQPLLPLRLFADRDRAAGFLAFLLGPAAMMSSFFFLTQFLQDVRHLTALATGVAFLPMAVGMFTMTRLVPRLLQRFGPKPLVLTGTVLMVVGLLMLTRLSVDSGYAAAVFAPMLVLGVGGGLGFSPLTPVIMATVEAADAGAAGGALQTMQQVGASLGLAVLVSVFGAAVRHAGPVSLPVGMVSGMTAAFTVAAGVAAGVLLIALTFRRSRAPQR
ncbi:MAG TPA: MFS transporter [Streptosporangiales bacterium]